MAEIELLIVCPLFNEVNNVQRLIDICNECDSRAFFLFVDSGSDDGTRAILEQSKGSRLNVILFSENLGVNKNWARAAEAAATYRFVKILFLGGDDSISPEFVTQALNIPLKESEVAVPNFIGDADCQILRPQIIKKSRLATNWELVHLCYAVMTRSAFRKDFLRILGSTNSVGFDWWLAFALLRNCKVLFAGNMTYNKFQKNANYSGDYYAGRGNPQSPPGAVNQFLEPLTKWAFVINSEPGHLSIAERIDARVIAFVGLVLGYAKLGVTLTSAIFAKVRQGLR